MHPPFLNEFVAFILKVCMPTYLCHSTYCYVKQEAVKKHAVLCKRRDQQMKAVIIYCYCISETVCEVGVFITTLENIPTSLSEEPL